MRGHRYGISLQEYCIENHMEYLLAEWDYEKNKLLPSEITAGSKKKVWWKLSYKDEKTGNHFNFEWYSQIIERASGVGCPYLSNHAVWVGFNDLATTHPELATQWHPTKNGDLKPEDVTAGSNKKVWWIFPYDDEKTGKCFNFSWQASILSRVKWIGCPYLSGQAVWKGFNDLATTHPELAIQWDYEKNKDLMPESVTAKSGKKVWWILQYDDEKTGKHFNFSWKAVIANRANGSECPYLSGKSVWTGFNDLETYCRQHGRADILNQWDYKKNKLLPSEVIAKSEKRVWWAQSYDDEKTGKCFNFLWQASVANRIKGNECPYLSGRAVWKGFNDLATTYPEIAAQWHPVKNGNLTPENVTAGSGRRVWWILIYNDEKTGRQFNFEWQAQIVGRTKGVGCPYLSGRAVWKGFNDLETYCKENGRLDILSWWDYEKNGDLKPSDVTAGSGKKVWWIKDGKSCLRGIQGIVNFKDTK